MIETTLAELADRFDVFLLDQFGVLLDGTGAYEKAPDALATLANRGKKIGIISNSGKRAAPNAARLEQKGFDLKNICTLISSGEAAHAILSGLIGTGLIGAGWIGAGWIGERLQRNAKVLILSRDNDLSCIEGLDLVPIDVPEQADLILISGSKGDVMTLSDYAETLKPAAARQIPALCTNPDMTMLTEQGTAFGAGSIARLYRELGGEVDAIGKPHPLIYQVAADRLGISDPARVLCVGDSPAHDIRGGHAAGYSTALVRTGIHADAQLTDLIATLPHCERPDYVIPGFVF
jgi:HAD superfamily hydrolase (TIGR01459 family)